MAFQGGRLIIDYSFLAYVLSFCDFILKYFPREIWGTNPFSGCAKFRANSGQLVSLKIIPANQGKQEHISHVHLHALACDRLMSH